MEQYMLSSNYYHYYLLLLLHVHVIIVNTAFIIIIIVVVVVVVVVVSIDREPNSKQKTLKAKDVLRWELDPSLHGSVVEMTEMTCGGQNVLAFVTTKGHLCGLDLRTPNLAWDLENDPRHGIECLLRENSSYTIDSIV